MTRGTISIYLFIPLKVTVYTSRLEKLKHDCAGGQLTHVCPVRPLLSMIGVQNLGSSLKLINLDRCRNLIENFNFVSTPWKIIIPIANHHPTHHHPQSLHTPPTPTPTSTTPSPAPTIKTTTNFTTHPPPYHPPTPPPPSTPPSPTPQPNTTTTPKPPYPTHHPPTPPPPTLPLSPTHPTNPIPPPPTPQTPIPRTLQPPTHGEKVGP